MLLLITVFYYSVEDLPYSVLKAIDGSFLPGWAGLHVEEHQPGSQEEPAGVLVPVHHQLRIHVSCRLTPPSHLRRIFPPPHSVVNWLSAVLVPALVLSCQWNLTLGGGKEIIRIKIYHAQKNGHYYFIYRNTGNMQNGKSIPSIEYKPLIWCVNLVTNICFIFTERWRPSAWTSSSGTTSWSARV